MTSIFLAGGEGDVLTSALVENGITRILYSFWYLQSAHRQAFVRRWQGRHPEMQFFLDSGAFTFWQMSQRANAEDIPDWRKYKKTYFAYIDQTWGRWARIAELDLDKTFPGITEDIITEWREEMLERWPDAPITPVWHSNRGLKEWTRYCEDPRMRHLAIGSGSGLPPGQIMRMCHEAHKHGKLVHGFGITRVNSLVQLTDYDSIDSSSWLAASKYGVTFIFQGNRFQYLARKGYRAKGQRSLFRTYFTRIGCDWRLIEADGREEKVVPPDQEQKLREFRAKVRAEVRKSSIIAWRLLSDRLEYLKTIQKRSLYGKELEIEGGELTELLAHPPRIPRE